ncbi:hypothetical protein HELRODRAFT_190469 [Helobdella robusta]|uniref:Peptidase S9 prolyl oligopeptidase catalytic domain-containing protein n=1 Tax=Helobdella robusta TaxID=6412 RepID=T1FS04_HELRO|nr:hypothetical protein HELRODRAFT_190469 [Helobdella robusta]ESO09361.1 hypothetical protein HELRODRAFT_190469 [Helobdella robusta]
MTCNETSDCQYVAATFGPKARHYILGCLGPRIPTYELKTVDSERSLMLEDNKKLAEALTAKILPDRKHITVAVGNGQTATVELIEPQEEGSKKFPLLILASGEPGTQQVSDRFHLGWETYLASKEEVVVAKVDGRGSGGRGVTYRNQIHKKLTEMDVEDHQLIALFLKHHELVDPAKVAIMGWGHSGLVAMHSLANDSDIFPCGITGGALLDPHYYDAPFFEKYMGLSNQNYNLQAILKTGVASKLTNLRTKKLAIIQALGDDHISYASTSNALKVLEDNDIIFRYQIYRDLSSSRLTPHRHVYHLMTDFLKNDCFAYFWKHDTKSWIVDKSVKKDKFRIKQFCV